MLRFNILFLLKIKLKINVPFELINILNVCLEIKTKEIYMVQNRIIKTQIEKPVRNLRNRIMMIKLGRQFYNKSASMGFDSNC
jgi:hypothetical protein